MSSNDQPARDVSCSANPDRVPGDPDAPCDSTSERQTLDEEAMRAISPAVVQQIDENLKLLYRRQVEQELPPKLQALVAQLRAGSGSSTGGDTT